MTKSQVVNIVIHIFFVQKQGFYALIHIIHNLITERCAQQIVNNVNNFLSSQSYSHWCAHKKR